MLFEKSRETLLINSLFDMKVKLQKHVGKTGSKTSPKSYSKTGQKTHLYRHQKGSHWDQFSGQIGLSIDRPVDRPMVKFLTVGVAGRLHPKLDSVGRRPKSESGLEPFD